MTKLRWSSENLFDSKQFDSERSVKRGWCTHDTITRADFLALRLGGGTPLAARGVAARDEATPDGGATSRAGDDERGV